MVSCISCKISHVVRGRSKDISFHRFPSNSSLRKAWLEFLKLKENELPRRGHLCSQHFEETAFDRSSHLKVRLKTDAVPSVLILRKRNDKRSTGGLKIKKESNLEQDLSTKMSSKDSKTFPPIKIEYDIDISETIIEDVSNEADFLNPCIEEILTREDK